MGDKDPKSTKKQSAQKQNANDKVNQAKKQAAFAKQSQSGKK